MQVILIEDHALFREGITLILKQLGDTVDVACGDSLQDATDLVTQFPNCDLILLDYHLTGSNGIDCLHELKTLCPNTPAIMLSAERDSGLIQQALNTGAKGFITKSSSSKIMLSAIKLVLSGGIYIPPELISPVNDTSASPANRPPLAQIKPSSYHLTGRQLEVLEQMIGGQSNKEIAKVLNMSPSTVKVHVAAILRELNVKNRTQAVNIARTDNIFSA